VIAGGARRFADRHHFEAVLRVGYALDLENWRR
jgi:hypothetical protein